MLPDQSNAVHVLYFRGSILVDYIIIQSITSESSDDLVKAIIGLSAGETIEIFGHNSTLSNITVNGFSSKLQTFKNVFSSVMASETLLLRYIIHTCIHSMQCEYSTIDLEFCFDGPVGKGDAPE